MPITPAQTQIEDNSLAQINVSERANYVLIVDDDPDFLDLLTQELGQIEGITIDVAHTSQEALNLLTRNAYKLVVSDWSLEQSTGPEVLSKADGLRTSLASVLNLQSKIPVVFISASDRVSETLVLHALKHFEPVSFIRKSCGPPLIGLVAERILVRYRGQSNRTTTATAAEKG